MNEISDCKDALVDLEQLWWHILGDFAGYEQIRLFSCVNIACPVGAGHQLIGSLLFKIVKSMDASALPDGFFFTW